MKISLFCTVLGLPALCFSCAGGSPPPLASVMVTEIHASPSPATEVADAEFLELYNSTQADICIGGWTLADASSADPAVFPDLVIPKGSFLVVCAVRDTGLFGLGLHMAGLSRFPALNNSGDGLTLREDGGRVVFYIEYDDAWYADALKSSGGWSLEMKDRTRPCAGGVNWVASADPSGGTPGRVNSVDGPIPASPAVEALFAEVVAPAEVHVKYSSQLDPAFLAEVVAYADGGIGRMHLAEIQEPDLEYLVLTTGLSMKENKVYHLSVSGLRGCSGRPVKPAESIPFGIPVEAEPGDIMISEVLFNPVRGGTDFVELYNRSGNLLSVRDLVLAEAATGSPDSLIDAGFRFGEHRIVEPFSYLALTEIEEGLLPFYHIPDPSRIVSLSDMPNYPDDEGVVVLSRKDAVLMDRMVYREEMHHPMISDAEGVSLERISYDAPAQDADNWHSASSLSGFATPGYLNSATAGSAEGSGFTANPKILSPDGDGNDDFTLIGYSLDRPGYNVNVRVYDTGGRLVTHLARNEIAGREGFFRWDGSTDKGNVAPEGLYIILVEWFHVDGRAGRCLMDVALVGTRSH